MMAEYISYGALYLAEAVIAWRYFEALFCRRASGLRVGLSFAAAYILLFCATWLDSVVLNGAAFFVCQLLLLRMDYECRWRSAVLHKDLYYDVLAQSQNGWHEGTENALPFIKYLLGTILAAYKDLNERVMLVGTKLPALEMVRRAGGNKIGRFNKQDIRELCPTLSGSSIEGALRKLISDGELKKEGKGKSACYFRLK